jgi:excisionase family DNA binding protein
VNTERDSTPKVIGSAPTISRLMGVDAVLEQAFGGEVSRSFLYKLVRTQQLRCIRVGRKLLFDQRDVVAFVEERRRQSAADGNVLVAGAR